MQVKRGDALVFHILSSRGGIVAVGTVTTEMFESVEDIWGKDAG